MKAYDISNAFAAIEDELIDSMMRNMKRHKVEEAGENRQWSMWQAEQLKSLELYRKKNEKKFHKTFGDINTKIEEMIRSAKYQGEMDQELEILDAIKSGFKGYRPAGNTMQGAFFALNERKLNALLAATVQDMEKAEYAMLRFANDQYRQIIFNAQVYANTGAGTYEQSVDMAAKDFLSKGINCIQYANGARHTIKDYARMAIRTANKRAYLYGEGQTRQEWGIHTVIVQKRGNPCPKCLPFVGKVLIDDVYSCGSKTGSSNATGVRYPTLSSAMAAGLYHPNCKDIHTTYFEGISTPPSGSKYTKDELDEIADRYSREQKHQYAVRQAKKFERMEKYSLDDDNKEKNKKRKKLWKSMAAKIDVAREHEPKLLMQLEKGHRDAIINILGKSDRKIQEITLKYLNDITFINEKALGTAVSGKRGIRVNLKNDEQNIKGKYTSVFHEIGHSIDRAAGGLSAQKPDFKVALESDFINVVNAFEKEYNFTQDETYSEIGRMISEPKFHSVSDITGGLTGNKCVGRYSHQTEYWNKDHALEKEAFAHFYEAYARNDLEKISILSEMFPSATEEFLKLIGG